MLWKVRYRIGHLSSRTSLFMQILTAVVFEAFVCVAENVRKDNCCVSRSRRPHDQMFENCCMSSKFGANVTWINEFCCNQATHHMGRDAKRTKSQAADLFRQKFEPEHETSNDSGDQADHNGNRSKSTPSPPVLRFSLESTLDRESKSIVKTSSIYLTSKQTIEAVAARNELSDPENSNSGAAEIPQDH